MHSAASSRAGSGPQDDDERQRALDAGHDLDPDYVLTTDDLVTGDDCFFVATGITDGELMRGRALPRRRRHDPLAGDALAQRHDPLDHLRAPALRSYAPTPPSTSTS